MTTATMAQRAPKSLRPSDPLVRAMAYIRERYLDGACTEHLPAIAGMDPTDFPRAFKKRFGKTPARARAELQVADVQKFLRQGVPQVVLHERTGFPSRQKLSNVFREVALKSPTDWLAEERKKDPTIPAQPKRPGRPKSAETRAKLSASVKANWAKRTPTRRTPAAPPKGEQPYVTPAARAIAEIKRGAAAFDAHQRRMAAERDAFANCGPMPVRETRPSRVREEASPIDPRVIPIVDNTPTLATCFGRFGRGAAGGDRDDFGGDDD